MRLSKPETQSIAPTPKFKRGRGAFPPASAELFMAYHSVVQEREMAAESGSKDRYERMDSVACNLWNALRKMGAFKC